jgi:hypothetical protein
MTGDDFLLFMERFIKHNRITNYKPVILLKVSDDSIVIQLLCLWTSSYFLFKTPCFGDCILSLPSGGTYSVGPSLRNAVS